MYCSKELTKAACNRLYSMGVLYPNGIDMFYFKPQLKFIIMKNVKQVTTAPYSRLGFQSQVLSVGDTVEIYNAITCKVAFTGKITSLTVGSFVTGGNMRGCIVCNNGDVHESNGLQTAKKIA